MLETIFIALYVLIFISLVLEVIANILHLMHVVAKWVDIAMLSMTSFTLLYFLAMLLYLIIQYIKIL